MWVGERGIKVREEAVSQERMSKGGGGSERWRWGGGGPFVKINDVSTDEERKKKERKLEVNHVEELGTKKCSFEVKID